MAIPFLRKALVHSAGVVQRGLAAGSGAPVWGEYGDGCSLGPEWKVIRSQVKPDGEVDFAATMKLESSRKGDCTPGQHADCAFALDAYHPRRLSVDPAANPNSTPRRREMK